MKSPKRFRAFKFQGSWCVEDTRTRTVVWTYGFTGESKAKAKAKELNKS